MPIIRKEDDWHKLVMEIHDSANSSKFAFWNYSGVRLTHDQITRLLLSSPSRWNEFKRQQKHRLVWYHIGKEIFWLPGYFVKLQNSSFNGADLSHRDLSAINFSNSAFRRANFSYSKLGGMSHGGLADYTRIIDCDCRNSKFVVSEFDGVRASGTDFSSAEFNGAVPNRTDLRNTKFYKSLFAAPVTDCDLQDADFKECHVAGSSFFDTNISAAKNIHRANFLEHNRIDYKTIKLSKKLPRSLLRSCGVANDHIKYIDKISHDSHRLPNYFISYSDSDREFASRFATELEGHGIRTWLAPRDLPFGASTREYLERTIHRHGKLLVILSSKSLISPWVEFEVETAFEIERKKRAKIVIPVTIDTRIFNTKVSWARHLLRTRNIADFRKWRKLHNRITDEFVDRLH